MDETLNVRMDYSPSLFPVIMDPFMKTINVAKGMCNTP